MYVHQQFKEKYSMDVALFYSDTYTMDGIYTYIRTYVPYMAASIHISILYTDKHSIFDTYIIIGYQNYNLFSMGPLN